MGRTINKIIVHCTATRPLQSCTISQIDKWHRERGFDGIGYHYVIYRDGSIHEGRPLSKVGAHCVGQNSDSIGIAYCGGVAEDGTTPQDNRTAAQKVALNQLISELRQAYGDIPVYGHRDFSDKACPSYDASKEHNN
ncbi:MAG: N-acetylmuramoyl-L-alanine amidase [Bacteroidia bacterium]|nr:N-acetylmuramoyl-L-alanine amidase [Bacteroidia bacterium]